MADPNPPPVPEPPPLAPGGKPSTRWRWFRALGALLLLLSWLATTLQLEKRLEIQGEQRWADAYGWMGSNISALSSQLQLLISEVELLNVRLAPPSSSARNPRFTDTSLALIQVEADLRALETELNAFGSTNVDRAQSLLLEAATLPGSDSITHHLIGVILSHVTLRLKVDSVRDSLATLVEQVDAQASSQLPLRSRSLSSETVATWAAAEVAGVRSTLDSVAAMLDRYDSEIPAKALDHRVRTSQDLQFYRTAMIVLYVAGAFLLLLAEFYDRSR